ncbi:hypothetical protein CIL05_20805 [Virgibacillus profundi]|uniref:DUF3267 domain-containing protein n=1 Tax=Virgibacillus profundi TaxID=2024555 RepID=A0A2A2I8D3_9BACI|nr:DUF3267 domain-containing protein [Virgibacillus profundi]PAV27648.1 hypothetical protein CIL05_20805 [Virgibacillus profundi]PXY51978.1 DUF3267 domain-containing protein [Virgibacillus profundi]
MKLEWKGIYKSKDQLPVGDLPLHAVKFKEPDSMLKLNVVAALFVLPVIILIVLAIFLKSFLTGSMVEIRFFNLWGFILAFLMILPHEYLHAIVFPKGEKVELWVSPLALAAFVVSTAPISKGRFIFLSLLPNIVFGFLPLLIWIYLPQSLAITDIIFSFASLSLLFGIGDYLNVFNATFQMPRGSIQQLSGMNSYWYMPKKRDSSFTMTE